MMMLQCSSTKLTTALFSCVGPVACVHGALTFFIQYTICKMKIKTNHRYLNRTTRSQKCRPLHCLYRSLSGNYIKILLKVPD